MKTQPVTPHPLEPRARLRDLGIAIGRFPTGLYNAITDVPGVLVGHKTVIRDEPSTVRTGVTAILPRGGLVHQDHPFAGFYSLNGIGEMTGLHLLEEWGLLTTPIILTNTNQVGLAMDALTRYGATKHGGFAYKLPVVAETYDGFLNDIDSFPLIAEDVIAALENAVSGPVAEGNVGGGTGMICYDFKGGIGTASRQVALGEMRYTVGCLVQANHGDRHMLRVNGAPVGEILNTDVIPGPRDPDELEKIESSSILIITATDAPLLPAQCKRLSRRAALGLARTGGAGFNSSGDLFLTFATGNHYTRKDSSLVQLQMVPHNLMDPLIEATIEAVEEAVLNALTAAQTMTGYRGRTVEALPLSRTRDIVMKTRPG